MDILVIIAKVLASIFLAGLILGGIIKLSPAHRNPDIEPLIENIVGGLGLLGGIFGIYYLWS